MAQQALSRRIRDREAMQRTNVRLAKAGQCRSGDGRLTPYDRKGGDKATTSLS